MIGKNKRSTIAMAVIVSVLGAAILFILALVDGPEKWLFVGVTATVMIGFLIPVLRNIRKGNSP